MLSAGTLKFGPNIKVTDSYYDVCIVTGKTNFNERKNNAKK